MQTWHRPTQALTSFERRRRVDQPTVLLQVKEVTSTPFGLVIGFLLPGVVALFSLTYWYESAANAFDTFLTSASNLGLFIFLLLGALTLGIITSAVRWIVFEKLLNQIPDLYGKKVSDEERRRMYEQERFAAWRAGIDEEYRYHQFFGGLTIKATSRGPTSRFLGLELMGQSR
jgi:hypothetical protein